MSKNDGLKIHLHERQAQALLTPATEILFGGAAGGGKSFLLRALMIYFCVRIPGLCCYLFRRLYPDLHKNHFTGPASFHVMLAPLILAGKCIIVKGEIRFWNGSRIFTSHLLREETKFNFQGQEIHLLGFDELTHFTETQYRYLRARCRLGGLPIPKEYQGKFPMVISGSNPGGIGHIWVKNTFVKPGAWTIRRTTKKEGGMLRQFIPSRLADNPTQDAGYADVLAGLGDAALVRAMLDGDWNIVAGAMFGDTWRDELHICEPFAIPCDWPIWRGGDDGFASPSAVEWLTQDPTIRTIYGINELYGSHMLPDFMAERIMEIDRSVPLLYPNAVFKDNPDVLSGLYDSAAFNDLGLQEKDTLRGPAMNKLGCNWEPVEKGPNSRAARAQHLHRLLAPNKLDPKKRPGIRFFRGHCPVICEILPTLPRDPKQPECVDKKAEDHSFDALTYGLQWIDGNARKHRISGT